MKARDWPSATRFDWAKQHQVSLRHGQGRLCGHLNAQLLTRPPPQTPRSRGTAPLLCCGQTCPLSFIAMVGSAFWPQLRHGILAAHPAVDYRALFR